MLYITSTTDLIQTDLTKLYIAPGDTLVLIESGKGASLTLPKSGFIEILSHIHAKDVRLIAKDDSASLVALGALLSKSAQAIVVGNPFLVPENEKGTYISETFKGYKVSAYKAEKANVRKTEKKERVATVKKERPVKEQPPKEQPSEPKPADSAEPKPAAEPKKRPSVRKKSSLFEKLGIKPEMLDDKAENRLSDIINKSKDYMDYRGKVLDAFGDKAGVIMLKTGGMAIEDLKAILQ